MVEILSSEWAEQRLSHEVMTDFAGVRCLSSIHPFISIRGAANNQFFLAGSRSFSPKIIDFLNKNHLQSHTHTHHHPPLF